MEYNLRLQKKMCFLEDKKDSWSSFQSQQMFHWDKEDILENLLKFSSQVGKLERNWWLQQGTYILLDKRHKKLRFVRQKMFQHCKESM